MIKKGKKVESGAYRLHCNQGDESETDRRLDKQADK